MSEHRSNVLCAFESTVGYGHLRRMSHIANGLARNGINVYVATGTKCRYEDYFDSNINIVNLPAHQIGTEAQAFSFDTQGNRQADTILSEDEWQKCRTSKIENLMEGVNFDAVILEFWPFVRRREFDPLIALLEKQKPMIFSSVRDLTCTTNSAEPLSKEQLYVQEAPVVTAINDRVEQVLVHADPCMVDFSQSFASYSQIAQKIYYTGYVVDQKKSFNTPRNKDITVSVGSGVRGYPLLAQTLQAMPYTLAKDHKWNFIMGPRIGDENEQKLRDLAEKIQSDNDHRYDLSLVRQDPNLQEAFLTTGLSISQAGYNTTLEVLSSGAPNLFVPDFKQNEAGIITQVNEEQTIRLIELKKAGLVEWLEPKQIFESRQYALEIDNALGTQLGRAVFDMNGIEKTTNFICNKLQSRPH